MNPRLKKLYKSVILEHSKSPVNYAKPEASMHQLDAYNALCGDRFQLYFDLTEGRIENLSFHGYGCAISKASTSVLVQFLAGKSVEEAQSLSHAYLQNLETENSASVSLPEEFEAFTAARDFPGRMKCASLAWEEFMKFVVEEG